MQKRKNGREEWNQKRLRKGGKEKRHEFLYSLSHWLTNVTLRISCHRDQKTQSVSTILYASTFLALPALLTPTFPSPLTSWYPLNSSLLPSQPAKINTSLPTVLYASGISAIFLTSPPLRSPPYTPSTPIPPTISPNTWQPYRELTVFWKAW